MWLGWFRRGEDPKKNPVEDCHKRPWLRERGGEVPQSIPGSLKRTALAVPALQNRRGPSLLAREGEMAGESSQHPSVDSDKPLVLHACTHAHVRTWRGCRIGHRSSCSLWMARLFLQNLHELAKWRLFLRLLNQCGRFYGDYCVCVF